VEIDSFGRSARPRTARESARQPGGRLPANSLPNNLKRLGGAFGARHRRVQFVR